MGRPPPRRSARSLMELPGTPYGRGERVVALTFDDGPHPSATEDVLEVLARFGVSATFFVLGRQAVMHPDVVRAVAAAGHTVGNHTWDHVRLAGSSEDLMQEQVGRTDELLADLVGRRTRYVRPPGGHRDEGVLRWFEEAGLVPVNWNVDPEDWSRPGPEAIMARTFEALRPGAIVLLHDGLSDPSGTVAALPGIVAGILERGYRAVAL